VSTTLDPLKAANSSTAVVPDVLSAASRVIPAAALKRPATGFHPIALAHTMYVDSVDRSVNVLGDEGKQRIRAAYPGPTSDRLVEIKRRYDPTNVFRLNQNIPPS
jgi:Berberine and berberine like